jgi:hypothetical protein
LEVKPSISRGSEDDDICNFLLGVPVPIPTLLPVRTKSFCPYCPATTRSSAKTSNTGNPALLFTESNESDKSSTMVNNVPFVPSVLNKVSLGTDDVTCSLAVGLVVPIPIATDALSNTIEFAIVVAPVNFARYPVVPPGLTPVAPCAPCAPPPP